MAHELMPDRVHLFVRVGPTDAAAAVVCAVKRRTARVLRQEFAHLRNLAGVGQLGFQMITLTSESRALRRGAAEAFKEATAQDI